MGKKKKNKKYDMWDLSYEEQQENLRKLDEFLAGTKNDMFINNTGTDFESQLFSMIDTRRNKETIVDDNEPKPRYFDQYGIFQYTETDGMSDTDDDEEISEDVLEYQPVSFEVDDELQMVFIQSRFERVGLKLNTSIIPDDIAIENEQILGRAFIDYALSNTIPFAVTDDIKKIIDVFDQYNINTYDKNRFKIIYDKDDMFYRCYILDTSSTGNLQANVIKSFREYAELILELENRTIDDIDWGNFYDSRYNNLENFARIISADINTSLSLEAKWREDMFDVCGYVITTEDIYSVVAPLLEASIEDDEDDDEFNELAEELADMSDEEIEEMVNEVVKEVQPVATVEIKTTTTTDGEVEDKKIVAEVVIDVEDLKDKMQSSEVKEEPQISSYINPQQPPSHVDEDESKEDKPVNIPDDIEVTETDPDEIDFDDLSEIPVIRKPKKK
jgi:hypothetical protein